MELNIEYLNDSNGNIKAVQIPIKDWFWLQNQISKYSKELKIKKDLIDAFTEVKQMQTGILKKQSLNDFLNDV